MPEGPILAVTWFEAAQYCNWLSDREGIPEREWCYPKEIKDGMQLSPDFLKRLWSLGCLRCYSLHHRSYLGS